MSANNTFITLDINQKQLTETAFISVKGESGHSKKEFNRFLEVFKEFLVHIEYTGEVRVTPTRIRSKGTKDRTGLTLSGLTGNKLKFAFQPGGNDSCFGYNITFVDQDPMKIYKVCKDAIGTAFVGVVADKTVETPLLQVSLAKAEPVQLTSKEVSAYFSSPDWVEGLTALLEANAQDMIVSQKQTAEIIQDYMNISYDTNVSLFLQELEKRNYVVPMVDTGSFVIVSGANRKERRIRAKVMENSFDAAHKRVLMEVPKYAAEILEDREKLASYLLYFTDAVYQLDAVEHLNTLYPDWSMTELVGVVMYLAHCTYLKSMDADGQFKLGEAGEALLQEFFGSPACQEQVVEPGEAVKSEPTPQLSLVAALNEALTKAECWKQKALTAEANAANSEAEKQTLTTQVEGLQKELDDLREMLAEAEETVAELESRLEELEADSDEDEVPSEELEALMHRLKNV